MLHGWQYGRDMEPALKGIYAHINGIETAPISWKDFVAIAGKARQGCNDEEKRIQALYATMIQIPEGNG